jgi:hypothetical protein
MFKKKPKNQDETDANPTKLKQKKHNWLKISVFANVAFLVIIGVASASGVVIHESDTNPNFCGSCHIMESHVTSYLTSDNLDNAHAQAGVECKDCHDYPVPAEIEAGIKYVTGDYVVDEDGELLQRDFGDEIRTQCHISY